MTSSNPIRQSNLGATDDPLVSIVIPAFNASRTIVETLRSALDQTYANLEIVVVDDGSIDDTGALVGAMAEIDPRIRLIRKDNGGVASARNRGIDAARGSYIAPLDADDIWHRTNIEKKMARLVSGEDIGFVYSLYRRIDEDNNVLTDGPDWNCSGWSICRHLYVNVVGNGSCLVARKKTIQEAGGYDEKLHFDGCEDFMLQLRICASKPILNVPEYLVGYRSSSDSMSTNMDWMRRSELAAINIIESEAPSIPRQAIVLGKIRAILSIAAAEFKQGRTLSSAGHIILSARMNLLNTVGIVMWTGLKNIQTAAKRIFRRVGPTVKFQDLDPSQKNIAQVPSVAPWQYYFAGKFDEIYQPRPDRSSSQNI